MSKMINIFFICIIVFFLFFYSQIEQRKQHSLERDFSSHIANKNYAEAFSIWDRMYPNDKYGEFGPYRTNSMSVWESMIRFETLEGIKIMLDRGLNIDHEDKDGNTALTYAVLANKENVVLFLLERGANPNHKNKKGESPRDIAKERKNINEIFETHTYKY